MQLGTAIPEEPGGWSQELSPGGPGQRPAGGGRRGAVTSGGAGEGMPNFPNMDCGDTPLVPIPGGNGEPRAAIYRQARTPRGLGESPQSGHGTVV